MTKRTPTSRELNRRRALQLFAAAAAASLGACGPAPEEIVPYVELPEGLTPGMPLQFATAVPFGGYARGVIATTWEGRPTKLEGNPRHPASLGATDIFIEAAIMSLYEPDRSQSPKRKGGLTSWGEFERALQAQMQKERTRGGAGLRILTGTVTSPTFARQMQALLAQMPQAQWVRYEPVNDDNTMAGAEMAFGQRLVAIPRFRDARIVLTLDADPLGPGPMQLANARAWSHMRQPNLPLEQFLRLYAVESMWRLTGANADERLTLAPARMAAVAIEIANRLGASLPSAPLDARAQRFAQAAADDLLANKGAAMVLAGETQAREVHALAHWINSQLQAPVDYIAPLDAAAKPHVQSLKELSNDLRQGKAETLIVLDANPAYTAPGDLQFGDCIARASFSAHLGIYDNETAAACRWQLPMTHALESWSDLRAFDGTASIAQPLIRPLYDARAPLQVLGLMLGDLGADPYRLVRETGRQRNPGADFEQRWRNWLNDGFIADTAAKPVPAPAARLPDIRYAEPGQATVLVTAPDPSLWDGACANNPWLQECPKPVTAEVWGNSLKMSPADAAALHVEDGDIVKIAAGDAHIEGPVHVQAGQPDGVVAATLGYGHSHVGAIGNGVGFDVNPLRRSQSPWLTAVTLERTGRRQEILRTQRYFELEGEEKHNIFRSLTVADRPDSKSTSERDEHLPTLMPERHDDGYKWGMVIDTSLCTGCNACVIACQSENNVPTVGPDEVAMGRIMHWLRVDSYFVHGEDAPPGFQPVPCMHCEHAPCEPVCPVAASVHDSEGLNVQVYNRCVGTRFCQSNCPYKVRRFNWFGYSQGQAYANLNESIATARYNPDVTVRARGVMEKCTYCVQRIQRAHHHAESTDTPIPDGGVVTACQAACPTRAIVFGNLNDTDAKVTAASSAPHHYALLGQLGTRPRTTYLARLANPNPALRDGNT